MGSWTIVGCDGRQQLRVEDKSDYGFELEDPDDRPLMVIITDENGAYLAEVVVPRKMLVRLAASLLARGLGGG